MPWLRSRPPTRKSSSRCASESTYQRALASRSAQAAKARSGGASYLRSTTSWRAPPIVRSSPATFRFVVAFGEVLTKAVEATLPARAPCADPSLRGPQRRRLDAAGPYAPNLLGADEAAHLQHLNVLYHRRQRHRQRLGELAHRGRSAAQALDDQHPAGIGQRVKDAIERLMPGALLKHSLKYTGAPACPVPRGGLMQKVLTDLRFCTTYEN